MRRFIGTVLVALHRKPLKAFRSEIHAIWSLMRVAALWTFAFAAFLSRAEPLDNCSVLHSNELTIGLSRLSAPPHAEFINSARMKSNAGCVSR